MPAGPLPGTGNGRRPQSASTGRRRRGRGHGRSACRTDAGSVQVSAVPCMTSSRQVLGIRSASSRGHHGASATTAPGWRRSQTGGRPLARPSSRTDDHDLGGVEVLAHGIERGCRISQCVPAGRCSSRGPGIAPALRVRRCRAGVAANGPTIRCRWLANCSRAETWPCSPVFRPEVPNTPPRYLPAAGITVAPI